MPVKDDLAQTAVEGLHRLVPGARLVRYRSRGNVQMVSVVLPNDTNRKLEAIRNLQSAAYVVERRPWMVDGEAECRQPQSAAGYGQLSFRFEE